MFGFSDWLKIYAFKLAAGAARAHCAAQSQAQPVAGPPAPAPTESMCLPATAGLIEYFDAMVQMMQRLSSPSATAKDESKSQDSRVPRSTSTASSSDAASASDETISLQVAADYMVMKCRAVLRIPSPSYSTAVGPSSSSAALYSGAVPVSLVYKAQFPAPDSPGAAAACVSQHTAPNGLSPFAYTEFCLVPISPVHSVN
jgi:hypothetical protein